MIKYEPGFLSKINSTVPIQNVSDNTPLFESAEVVDIILDSSHPLYEANSDIGIVRFRRLNSDFQKQETSLAFALPYIPHIQAYPLKGEIVLVFRAASSVIGTDGQDKVLSWYYISPINIWNLANNNLLPYSTATPRPNTTRANSYINFTGATSNQLKINFGDYYELQETQRLQPFEGDVIYQGRNGNYIRFTSNKDSTPKNTWSNNGTEGAPVLILSNHISNGTDLLIEDINKIDSSIWMASNSKIPLDLSCNNTKSLNKKPINTNKYIGKQILFNSDRIVLNAKDNDIFINSNKIIHIASNNSINIESDEIILDASKYKFGKNSTEQAVLGKELIDVLRDILLAISKITVTVSGVPSAVPNNVVEFTTIIGKLNKILSNKFFIE